MGIPFSLYGQNSKYMNISDPNYAKGFMDYETDGYNIAKELFSGIYTKITEEQRKHVEACLGIDSHISRKEMKDVFYKAFLKKGLTVKGLFRVLKFIIRHPFSQNRWC